MTRPILLVDYDPEWPRAFARLRDLARARLGDLALEIHHVGSTSIVGLAAKPKIDLDVVLTSAARIPEAPARLRPFDYECHVDPHGDGMWCLTKSHGTYGERLYLCAPAHPIHLDRLRFRDALATCPDTAADYVALKRRLAAEGDWARYDTCKRAFVARVLANQFSPPASRHESSGAIGQTE